MSYFYSDKVPPKNPSELDWSMYLSAVFQGRFGSKNSGKPTKHVTGSEIGGESLFIKKYRPSFYFTPEKYDIYLEVQPLSEMFSGKERLKIHAKKLKKLNHMKNYCSKEYIEKKEIDNVKGNLLNSDGTLNHETFSSLEKLFPEFPLRENIRFMNRYV